MKNKAKAMRHMLYGMVGAALCMAGDWLMAAYGKGNVSNGLIQSNWPKMPYIRFEIALILIAIGVPLYYVGLMDYVKAVRLSRRRRDIADMRMAKLFETGAVAGAVSYLFIKAGYVMMAIVYKLLYNTSLMGADIISTTEGMFYYMAIPAIAYYVISIAGISLAYMYFVYNGNFKVNKLTIILNPLIFLGLGELLKLSHIYYLTDFTSAAVSFGYMLMMAVGLSHVSQMRPPQRPVQ